MHLGDHDPATADWFIAELAGQARSASHLFILGDLFEAWIGDDHADGVCARTVALLAELGAAGTKLFVMRGNRDFLLDVRRDAPASGTVAAEAFSERCGATMLDDPCLVRLFGHAVLLSHGDALCTDDVDYQRFRALARSAAWQQAFLRTAGGRTDRAAREMRARSEQSKGGKAGYLMDVNPAAVVAAMRAAGAARLIHGHTHRPAEHRFAIDGAPAIRWVLPDWDLAGELEADTTHATDATGRSDESGASASSRSRGGFLQVDARGWRRIGAWAQG